jgi:hypothetical protein
MSDFSKFGIHPTVGGPGGILMPKLNYRFRVIFDGFGKGDLLRELTQNVEKVARPTYTQDPVEIHSYNSTVKIGGKHKWNTITISIRDDLQNSVAAAVGAQMQKQVNHFEQTSAISAADYKFRLEIQSLDGTHGDPLEYWNVEGCWLTEVKTQEGDYADSKQSLYELTICYDNATQLAGASVVPTVGGDPFSAGITDIFKGVASSAGFSA